MAANGKPRQYMQFGTAMLTPEIGAIVEKLAREDDRSMAFMIRKLIEESPRIKAALKNGRVGKGRG